MLTIPAPPLLSETDPKKETSPLIRRAQDLIFRVNNKSWPDPRTSSTVNYGITSACLAKNTKLLDWVVRAAEAYGTPSNFNVTALKNIIYSPEIKTTKEPLPLLTLKDWEELKSVCPKTKLDTVLIDKVTSFVDRFCAIPNWAGHTPNQRSCLFAYAKDLSLFNPYYSLFLHTAHRLRMDIIQIHKNKGLAEFTPLQIMQIPLLDSIWEKISASNFWHDAIGIEFEYGSNWGAVVAGWMGVQSAALEVTKQETDSLPLAEALSAFSVSLLYTDALSSRQIADIIEASVCLIPPIKEKISPIAQTKDRLPGPLRVAVLVGVNGDGVLPRFFSSLLEGLNEQKEMDLTLGVTSKFIKEGHYKKEEYRLASKLKLKDLTQFNRRQIQEYLRKELQADIVIHLDPHMPNVKTTGFLDRPAPLLVSGNGTAHSSGLKSILGQDAVLRITDEWTDPSLEGADALNTEKLIRLEHGAWIYSPWKHLDPKITELKVPPLFSCMEKYKGTLYFGFMGKPEKMTRASAYAWSPLFQKFDGLDGRYKGILRMRLPLYGGDEYKEFIINLFADELKWPSERVKQHLNFHAYVKNMEDYVKRFNIIDIALSSVPYADATTEGDALFMGLPVISYHRPEDQGRHSAHVGASLSAEVGHPEWHCITREGIIEQVEKLIRKPENTQEKPFLIQLKTELRRHFTEKLEHREALYIKEYGDALKSAYDLYCPENYKRKSSNPE